MAGQWESQADVTKQGNKQSPPRTVRSAFPSVGSLAAMLAASRCSDIVNVRGDGRWSEGRNILLSSGLRMVADSKRCTHYQHEVVVKTSPKLKTQVITYPHATASHLDRCVVAQKQAIHPHIQLSISLSLTNRPFMHPSVATYQIPLSPSPWLFPLPSFPPLAFPNDFFTLIVDLF